MRLRSGAPVRRKSRLVGSFERAFWGMFRPENRAKLRVALETHERKHRIAGRRNGPLGHIAIDLLMYMASAIGEGGRLDMSIATLMTRLKRCRQSIVRALQALQRNGFLQWARRFEIEPDKNGRNRYRQASNAYRILLPAGATAQKPAPADDDYASRKIKRDNAAADRRLRTADAVDQLDAIEAATREYLKNLR